MSKENWCVCLYPQCEQAGVCLNKIFGAGNGKLIEKLFSNIRNAALEEAANELLRRHAADRFPVPVVEIATRLGIQVWADSSYPNDGNGHIEIDDNGNVSIVVNSKHSPVRKRFTVAHEIAHSQFDTDYLNQHRSIDRDGNAADDTYRMRERRANEFAAYLLMPEEQFIQQWLVNPSVEKVADYFSVSKDAARFRAINIGLIPAS